MEPQWLVICRTLNHPCLAVNHLTHTRLVCQPSAPKVRKVKHQKKSNWLVFLGNTPSVLLDENKQNRTPQQTPHFGMCVCHLSKMTIKNWGNAPHFWRSHVAYVASKNAGQWQLLVEVGRNQIVVIHARCFALHGLSDQRWALQSRGTLQMEQWTIVNRQ